MRQLRAFKTSCVSYNRSELGLLREVKQQQPPGGREEAVMTERVSAMLALAPHTHVRAAQRLT
jgi:hypothetical protein